MHCVNIEGIQYSGASPDMILVEMGDEEMFQTSNTQRAQVTDYLIAGLSSPAIHQCDACAVRFDEYGITVTDADEVNLNAIRTVRIDHCVEGYAGSRQT
jgi:hypothetical protein